MLIALVGSNVRFKAYPAGRGFFLERLFTMYEVVRVSSISCSRLDANDFVHAKRLTRLTSCSKVFKTTIKIGAATLHVVSG